METTTWTYGGTSFSAGFPAALIAPNPAMQGTTVSFAAHQNAAAALTHDVARKADGWVPPRGRTL